jgi:hypothetical protein
MPPRPKAASAALHFRFALLTLDKAGSGAPVKATLTGSLRSTLTELPTLPKAPYKRAKRKKKRIF